jgi:iron complex transport system substrate-binding protein
LLSALADRIDAVTAAVDGAEPVSVAALEWLEPVYVGGHWVPQLVEMAGGIDALGLPGEKSRVAEWDEVAAARPDVVVCMPCGYDGPRAAEEAETYAERLATLDARRVVAVNAAAYFSRPGPRLVDGLELLAHLLHPERFPEPMGVDRPIELELEPAGA